MKTNSKIFTAATLVAVSFLGAAMNAQADVASQTVKYSDLNLNSQAGAAKLHARIRSAAAKVCGVDDSRELDQMVKAQACVDQAVTASLKSVMDSKPVSVAWAK